VRLTVLGAGPAYTDRPEAAGASYLVSSRTTNVLLDLGHGSFSRIFAAVAPEDLAAVAISHLHPDHFVDLVPFRHYLRYYLHPSRRMRVIGPGDLATRLDALHAEPGFASQALDIEPIGSSDHAVGDLVVRARRIAHTDDSYGMRVSREPDESTGPGLVYSGDCGRADDLRPLIAPGDTLLTEVSFGPGPVPAGVLHLDGPAVGALAAAAGVGRVLLTHLQMGFDPGATLASVRTEYDGPVEFVWPGSQIEI
jgi:ribonuclease BN (tRNA processing enzyme)